MKVTAYPVKSLLIAVAIGVDPVLSNKCRCYGIKVQAKQGVPVSVICNITKIIIINLYLLQIKEIYDTDL